MGTGTVDGAGEMISFDLNLPCMTWMAYKAQRASKMRYEMLKLKAMSLAIVVGAMLTACGSEDALIKAVIPAAMSVSISLRRPLDPRRSVWHR